MNWRHPMAFLKSNILKQKSRQPLKKYFCADSNPSEISWDCTGATIKLADGSQCPGSCLRCPDSPCINYNPAEFTISEFNDFPGDQDNKVCPTMAITWPIDSPAPLVDSSLCISCGICARRCPFGAISISSEKGAVINDAPNDYFKFSQNVIDPMEITKNSSLFNLATRRGILQMVSRTTIQKLYDTISSAMVNCGPQFPNHLSRNLLLALGMPCSMRRRGDVNIRMDIIFGFSKCLGTAEVEFAQEASLDSPRNILDNSAVLSSRYKRNIEDIAKLIVLLNLPNQRSEYWQIIEDIHSVLKAKIGTITVGALVILVWTNTKLLLTPDSFFYTDTNTRSIKKQIQMLTALPPNMLDLPGVLETQK